MITWTLEADADGLSDSAKSFLAGGVGVGG